MENENKNKNKNTHHKHKSYFITPSEDAQSAKATAPAEKGPEHE